MRKLFLLVASLFFIPAIGFADEGTSTEIQVDGSFYLISDGEASLQRANRDIDGEFVIPSEIEHEGTNYPVTAINSYAFYNWSGEICPITSIQVPSSVVTIGENAFGTTAITEMEIPSTVKKLGRNAFIQCPNLKTIVVNGGIEELGGSILGSGSKSLETFILGEGHTAVPTSACQNCVNLTNVELPSTLTTISDWAFNGCIGLKQIDLPLSVTSIGYQAFNYCGLTSIELPEGMTTLERSVFSWCEDLKDVKLPSSLEKIGMGAFFKCTSLENIDIPDNVTEIGTFGQAAMDYGCFSSCTSLKNIKFGNSLKIIGEDTFSGCTSLSDILLSPSIESLGRWAFSHCTSLQSITLGKSLETIGESCFDGDQLLEHIIVDPENQYFSTFDGILCDYEKTCLILAPKSISGSITVPSNIKMLGPSVFQACEGITELILNEGLESIEGYAISGCTNLHDLSIPASVSSISLSAFDNNYFKSFDIDANNQSYSFHGGALCNQDGTELLKWLFQRDESVTIPNSVISIGKSAFFGLNIQEVNFNNNLQSIDDYSFCYCLNLKKISIPNSVSFIGYEAFRGSGIVEIEFPTSLTEIPDGVCYGCRQLQYVKFPDSIETIGNQSFYNCSSLEEVVIPKNVRSIGFTAFWTSYSTLKKVRCLPLNPPEISNGAATFGYNLEIVEVYESVLDTYKNAPGWNEPWNCTFIGIPDEVTEVDNIPECNEFWSVYTIDGSFVMNTNDKSRLSSLPKGIYVINGKKVIK